MRVALALAVGYLNWLRRDYYYLAVRLGDSYRAHLMLGLRPSAGYAWLVRHYYITCHWYYLSVVVLSKLSESVSLTTYRPDRELATDYMSVTRALYLTIYRLGGH